ncbi:hemolysin family protein [Ruminococcaceae bacterium OttesenSCG-928-D13]|nr:hemolysin family protein [Ruminococcaceae bacterium OttesenSCG-928-D13]
MNAEPLSPGQIVGMLLLQVVLILINAFFASSELAVMQLNPNKLRRQAEEGDKAAPRILRMVESPSGFLSTIQIGITLAGFLASAFAADNFAAPVTNWLYYDLGLQGLSVTSLNTIVILLITIVLSYFTLVFGELVPKQIAIHKPYQVAKLTTGIIRGLAIIMKPVIWLLSASTRLVLRLFGIDGERGEEAVTEDEIRMMVDAGHEKGTIEAEEKELIENIFELDKTTARDVMTHRVDVVAIEADAECDEIIQIITESGLSRYPVYDDSLDDILGILSSRAYLLNLRAEQPKTVRELLRPARFVPETVRADILLREMQQCKDHLSLVLDEYGGFSGIVTMEDLIEEIVGQIYDEFDADEEHEITQLEDNLWRIAGDCDIEDIEEELSVKLPEDRDYDTLGGLVFSQLSTIPADGEVVEVEAEGLGIKTEPVIDHHVEWAQVWVLPHPGEEEDEAEKSAGSDSETEEKTEKRPRNGKK